MDTGENCIPNEELHNCCSLANIIGVITMRSVRWLGHMARKGERRDGWDTWHIKVRGEMVGTHGT